MNFAYYQTQRGSIAQLFTDNNQKTFICQYCGDVIYFSDLGMGNIFAFNLFISNEYGSGTFHICAKNPHLKQVKGRKDYQCENCKKIILKGEKHLYRTSIPTGPQRIHIEC